LAKPCFSTLNDLWVEVPVANVSLRLGIAIFNYNRLMTNRYCEYKRSLVSCLWVILTHRIIAIFLNTIFRTNSQYPKGILSLEISCVNRKVTTGRFLAMTTAFSICPPELFLYYAANAITLISSAMNLAKESSLDNTAIIFLTVFAIAHLLSSCRSSFFA
jgi:hypothetical protein